MERYGWTGRDSNFTWLAVPGYGSEQRRNHHVRCWPLLLGEIEAGSGLMAKMASLLRRSPRSREDRTHGRSPAQATRCFALALGYEDPQRPRLNSGPIRCWRCSWKGRSGQARIERDHCMIDGKPLAGKSTLNRLELTPVGADAGHRYKKIAARHRDLENWFVDAFLFPLTSKPASGDRFGPGRHR